MLLRSQNNELKDKLSKLIEEQNIEKLKTSTTMLLPEDKEVNLENEE